MSPITIAVAIALAAFALRVFPYLSSGVPYHTDTFPQLANAANLLAKTPVPLSPMGGFDTYNIFWPMDTLFYAASSVVLGVGPGALMPVLAPLVTSLMAVLFLAFMRSLGFGLRASAVATALFAFAGGTTMISTGVTKEGFALPLMVLVLLLLNVWLRTGGRGALALSAVSFAVLLASHSLTSVMGLLLAAYLVVATSLTGAAPRGRSLAAAAVLGGFTVLSYLYFYVYAVSNLPYDLQPSDVVSLLGYEVLLTAPVWLSAAFRLDLRRWGALWMGLIALGVTGLFASALAFHTLLDSPIASPYLLALILPYLGVAFLAAFGLRKKLGGGEPGQAFAALWALGILGTVAFTVFGTPGVVAITLRVVDFAYPGVAMLAGVALVSTRPSRGRAALGLLAVGVLLAGSAFVVPYSAYWSGPLGGSQRVYSAAEVSAIAWTGRAPANLTLYGDIRASYAAPYLAGDQIGVEGGYLYLAGLGAPKSGCILVDGLLGQIGYVGTSYGLPVNSTIAGHLSGQPSLAKAYADGGATLYCLT